MYVGADGLKIDSGMGAFYLLLISYGSYAIDSSMESVTFSLRPQLARVNLCAGIEVIVYLNGKSCGVRFDLERLSLTTVSKQGSGMATLAAASTLRKQQGAIPRLPNEIFLEIFRYTPYTYRTSSRPCSRSPQTSNFTSFSVPALPPDSTPETHITAVHSLPSYRTVLPILSLVKIITLRRHACTDRDRCRTLCKQGF